MTLKKQDIRFIRLAKAVLTQQFDKPITIPQLARKTGINESKLKEGFKELYGIGIHAFLTRLRLEKAKQLLETTSMAVTDITYLVGYSNITHFTSLFKKEMGITPTEWRGRFGKKDR
jgi:AraC-type DNA-binding domain-containing proteins